MQVFQERSSTTASIVASSNSISTKVFCHVGEKVAELDVAVAQYVRVWCCTFLVSLNQLTGTKHQHLQNLENFDTTIATT